MVRPSPPPSYLGVRTDLLAMVPPSLTVQTVLDVGCAAGATVGALRERHPGLVATGIELDPESATRARTQVDEVLVGDADVHLSRLASREARFDLVILGDVLEHLVDPDRTLRRVRMLCPSGRAIVSLPNVGHLSTFGALLEGRWPYRDRGLHDRTHLRWFGRKNLPELFAGAGFREVRRHVRHRIIERPHPYNEALEPLLRWVPVVRHFTAYQFLSLLAPAPEA
ncbi:MAG: class I SAM-dependent methyltransferase [Myxococcota bacterium]